MDEAFKSRIHISLYYPTLGLEQTKHIFETNIKRLETMEAAEVDRKQSITVDRSSILNWAEEHFIKNGELGRWNGRQIRNAFQTAASLAHYDALNPEAAEEGVKPGFLTWFQFDKVAQATRQFDEYMTKARRATDGEYATKVGIRASEHDDTAPPVGASRGFGIPQNRRNMQPPYGQSMQSSHEMYYPAQYAPPPQRAPQENIYPSHEYGRATPSQTSYETYGRAAPTTPSRPPPQHVHHPDSGISLEFGYRAQVVESLPMRDERSPQSMAMPVKQSYIAPEEHEARQYIQRPSAQPEGLGPGYQAYGQQPRQVSNVEQSAWEGSRG